MQSELCLYVLVKFQRRVTGVPMLTSFDVACLRGSLFLIDS